MARGRLDGDGSTTASARGSVVVDGGLGRVRSSSAFSGLAPFSEDDEGSTVNLFP